MHKLNEDKVGKKGSFFYKRFKNSLPFHVNIDGKEHEIIIPANTENSFLKEIKNLDKKSLQDVINKYWNNEEKKRFIVAQLIPFSNEKRKNLLFLVILANEKIGAIKPTKVGKIAKESLKKMGVHLNYREYFSRLKREEVKLLYEFIKTFSKNGDRGQKLCCLELLPMCYNLFKEEDAMELVESIRDLENDRAEIIRKKARTFLNNLTTLSSLK